MRTRLADLRGLGALLLVLALLVYANAVAAADSAESAFRATVFGQDADLAASLAAHQLELLHYALVEYGSLIVGIAGAALLVLGPVLRRALAR
jgi:hypothetical protein